MLPQLSSIRARADGIRVELTRAQEACGQLVVREGVGGASRVLADMLAGQALLPINRRRRRDERFVFLGASHPYTLARYNNTFRNERSVEISVARWFLSQGHVGKMLEVGNVLGHYGIQGHEVLDRYETIAGVLNVDIVDFVTPRPYDTVVSISTLEHVGRDESPCVPERAIAAFDKVVALAGERGRVLVTIPIGHNDALDDAIAKKRVSLPVEGALLRVDRQNRWVQAPLAEGLECRYGTPFNNANAVYVGMRTS